MSSDIALISVFAAGLLSFLSPCVLPLVPPYLTYLAGVSMDELSAGGQNMAAKSLRNKVLLNALFFVIGFSAVFTSLGAGASSIGLFVRQYQEILSIVAGIIIIVMGLHFLGVFRIDRKSVV